METSTETELKQLVLTIHRYEWDLTQLTGRGELRTVGR